MDGSPLNVVEEPKLRILYYLTFAGSGNRLSVNDDTDFDSFPPYKLGHLLHDVLFRVLYLPQKHWPGARIVLCRIDVKEAYRQTSGDQKGPLFQVTELGTSR